MKSSGWGGWKKYLNVCAWLITNWRGQWCHRCHSCCHMGSCAVRSFVPRDVSSLMCDTRYAPSAMPVIDDGLGLRGAEIERRWARKTGFWMLGKIWMLGKWCGDWCCAATWSVTHDTSDGRRLQSPRPPIKPHQVGGRGREVNNRDKQKLLLWYCLLLRRSGHGGWRLCVCNGGELPH